MKKQILFFSYELISGGAEKVMVDIVNHMDPSFYNITVLTINNCKSDINILNKNIKYEYIFSGLLREDRLFFKIFYKLSPRILYKLFIKKKYDIEIAVLEGIPAKIISGSTHSDSKKIAMIHADANNIAWPSKRYKDFKQELQSYESFDKLVFVSDNTKNSFREKFNINDEKCMVIFNPFDRYYIKNKANEKVEDITNNFNFLFCAIGRLDKVKGFDRLIKVFKEINNENHNIGLIIIGDGKEERYLNQLIENLNLAKNVKILGYKSNPYKYLKIADCYVCSSYSEGLSSTVIEAMIVGVPIIATDCGGMYEILENNCGIIVDNSYEGLKNGMEKLLKDSSVATDMIDKQWKASEKFTYDSYFQKILSLYEEP